MVIKSVNDQSPKSEYQSKEIRQDSLEDEDTQLQHPTREERLMKYKNQCENLVAYLTTSVCPQGLSRNELQNIKNQAKTHQWDSKSKKLEIVKHKVVSIENTNKWT